MQSWMGGGVTPQSAGWGTPPPPTRPGMGYPPPCKCVQTENIAFPHPSQWRIQDFPEEGALTPKGVGPTYYLAIFSRKLHENEEILGRGGARPSHPPLDPPLLRMRAVMIELCHHFCEL